MTAPNPSESPTSSQELDAILVKIAEIEGREGYEGSHIGEWLLFAHHLLQNMPIGEELWKDHVVGTIERGCDENGWRFFTSGSWWGEELDFYRAHITDRDSALVATAEGASRALAALLAWEQAIGGGEV